jgi:triosephosphate isomerase
MNGTIGDAIKLVTALKNLLAEERHLEIAVAPPFTALYSVSIALGETHILLGGQNLFWEEPGAFTGEVCGAFLKDVGCQFVILGHSERRQWFGETDKAVNLKIQAALKNELIPIVCVGESLKDREAGQAWDVVESQLKNAFNDIAIHDFERMTIAYEPVWAIGTGKNATPAQAGEMHQAIRHWLKRYFDAPTANKIKLLYGGSVKPDNAAHLMMETHVDGLLVGGASLDAESFAQIVKFEERIK